MFEPVFVRGTACELCVWIIFVLFYKFYNKEMLEINVYFCFNVTHFYVCVADAFVKFQCNCFQSFYLVRAFQISVFRTKYLFNENQLI